MYSAWRCLIYFSQIWRGGILELFSTINPCLSGLKLYSIHTMKNKRKLFFTISAFTSALVSLPSSSRCHPTCLYYLVHIRSRYVCAVADVCACGGLMVYTGKNCEIHTMKFAIVPLDPSYIHTISIGLLYP